MLRRSLTTYSGKPRRRISRSYWSVEVNRENAKTNTFDTPSQPSPEFSKPLPQNPPSEDARISDVREISIFPAFFERLEASLRPRTSDTTKTELTVLPSPLPESLFSAGLPPQTPGEPMTAIKQEIRRFTAGSQKLRLITNISSRPDSLRSSMSRPTTRSASTRLTALSSDWSDRTSSVLQTVSSVSSMESLNEQPNSTDRNSPIHRKPIPQILTAIHPGHPDVFLFPPKRRNFPRIDTHICSHEYSSKSMGSQPDSPSSWSTAASVATTVAPNGGPLYLHATKSEKWTARIVSHQTDDILRLHKSHVATVESTESLVKPRRLTQWNFQYGDGSTPRDSLNPPPPGGWRLSELPMGLSRETSVKRSRMRRRITAWKNGFKHWSKTKIRSIGKLRWDT